LREEATLRTLARDVLRSGEIEGEHLDTEQVRSSLARRLGIPGRDDVAVDRRVEGFGEMMLDATRHYERPLDQARLAGWHAALFPTGRSGLTRSTIGAWRDGAWRDGAWRDGAWRDGAWRDGAWRDGAWRDGAWRDGARRDGARRDGARRDGASDPMLVVSGASGRQNVHHEAPPAARSADEMARFLD